MKKTGIRKWIVHKLGGAMLNEMTKAAGPKSFHCLQLQKVTAEYDAVREHIQTLEKTNGWISVKDRLPEQSPDEYLVVNGGKVQLAIFMDGMWITPHRVSSITHWMPLPEPPKEEGT